MSRDSISQLLRHAVASQSKHRCGYCLTQALWIGSQLTVDHIIPRSLGGESILENLCLACWGCNLHKQARITAVDPDTGIIYLKREKDGRILEFLPDFFIPTCKIGMNILFGKNGVC